VRGIDPIVGTAVSALLGLPVLVVVSAFAGDFGHPFPDRGMASSKRGSCRHPSDHGGAYSSFSHQPSSWGPHEGHPGDHQHVLLHGTGDWCSWASA